MKEVYKDIKGYEELYQVSNKGNVKALDRYNVDKNGKQKFYPGKTLKPDIIRRKHTSYLRVTLCKNGHLKKIQIHRLVAETFIENPDSKSCVNHIDNNGSNNIVTNLEWCTHAENMVHAQKQGRLTVAQSKAGKTTGKKLRIEALNEIANAVGTEVNGYSICKYTGFKKGRHYIEARCLRCKLTSELAYRHVTRGKNSRCVKCRNVKDTNLQAWKDRKKI
jgi:hypothetical protein